MGSRKFMFFTLLGILLFCVNEQVHGDFTKFKTKVGGQKKTKNTTKTFQNLFNI
jgi:hypothetical protein